MKQSLGPRPRARLFVPAAALAAIFAVPAVASADVDTTRITSPAPGAVLEGASVVTPGGSSGSLTTTVSGTAPGAADGDTVDIFCDATFYGLSQVVELTGRAVTITDGRFSSSDVVVPQLPCVLRAIPTDEGVANDASLTPAQQAAYTGPAVLGGQYQAFGLVPGSDVPNLFTGTRGQARGAAQYISAGTSSPIDGQFGGIGGLRGSWTAENQNLRAVFFGSGLLGGFAAQAPGGP